MLIPEGYGQANIRFSGAAAPTGAEITIGFKNDAAQSALLCAQDIENAFLGCDFMLHATTALTYVGTAVKLGPNETGPSAEVAGSTAGSDGDDAGYPGTALLVQKVTALGGRAGRGRFYLPGIPKNEYNESGVVDSGVVSLFQGDMDDFGTAMEAADLPPYLLHGAGSPIETPTAISNLVVQAQLATQRRRNRR